MGSSSVAYYAVFELDTHTIAVASNNTARGTVSGGGTVSYGSKVNIEAHPKSGYKFDY